MNEEIRVNIASIRSRIEQACLQCGRNPEEVKLLLATKTVPAERIKIVRIPKVEMQELSMGMSGDLETAISERATMVRIGTAIFDQRSTLNSDY